jgi:hypothetical protein
MAQQPWPTYWSLKPKPKQQTSVEGKFGSVRSSECRKVDKTSERQKVDESLDRQIVESSKHQIDETPERRMDQTSKRQKVGVDNDQPDIFKKREVPRLDRYLELK